MKRRLLQNKNGFTLAEVLITLAIVGVVAALTIPAITAKYKKLVTETRLEKFYTTMNQAIRLSEIDNGDKKTWTFSYNDGAGGYSEQGLRAFYDKYYAKYLKTAKKVSYIRKSETTGVLLIYFADGSISTMEYGGSDYIFCTSEKSYKNKSEVWGKECFLFGFYPAYAAGKRSENFLNKGIEPYINTDWDGTINGLYTIGAHSKIIQINGWKIPKDYPVKF